MSSRNRAAIVLAVVSLALLWPGLLQPVLTIKATMELFGTTREIDVSAFSVLCIRSWAPFCCGWPGSMRSWST
jgi:hypothetical protein